jgi:gas vesicle protein
MSQRDGFTSGFLVGTILGGIAGGVVGALFAAKQTSETEESEQSLINPSLSESKPRFSRRRQFSESDSIETSRRSLEDKIAQLNTAIDEVRLSLGNVNGNAVETDQERSRSIES